MIVDFTYYQDTFLGNSIKEEDFDRFSKKAERFLNYATTNKIQTATESIADSIKECICELAECYATFEKMDKQALGEGEKIISSESVGTWSASYDTSAQRMSEDMTAGGAERDKRLYNIVKRYLAHTGLLYRGVI